MTGQESARPCGDWRPCRERAQRRPPAPPEETPPAAALAAAAALPPPAVRRHTSVPRSRTQTDLLAALCPAPDSHRAAQPTHRGPPAGLSAAGAPRQRPEVRVLSAGLGSAGRFGVELEFHGLGLGEALATVRRRVGGSVCENDPTCLIAADGREWNVEVDGACVELVSPILCGPDDLLLVQEIAAELVAQGAECDWHAGLHVHIDATHLSVAAAQRLVATLAANEHWLYPVWGVFGVRRERFCAPIGRAVARACAELPRQDRQALAARWGCDRMRGLNLLNFLAALPYKHTVEFRYLNGTLDPTTLACAVGLFVGLGEYVRRPAAGAGTDGAAPPTSLPTLLGALALPSSQDVRAHLAGLLAARVRSGLAALHLPMPPELAAALGRDGFLHALCGLLHADADADEVARLALWLATPPSARELRGTLAVRQFQARLPPARQLSSTYCATSGKTIVASDSMM